MDLRSIESLLERYYNGETTTEEERQLQEFFSGNAVPEHLKSEQISFRFLVSARNQVTGKDLDDRISDTLAAGPKNIRLPRTTFFVRLSAGIAASVMLVVGLYVYNAQNTPAKQQNSMNKQQLLAYVQTKRALLMISHNLNKGNEQIARISKLNDIETLLTNKKTDK